MRRLWVSVPVLLSGCGILPPNVAPPFEGMCDARAAQSFVGQPVSQEAGTAILRATGAKILRWAAPDTMMTMEFSPVRVTVHYGSDYRIGSIACG